MGEGIFPLDFHMITGSWAHELRCFEQSLEPLTDRTTGVKNASGARIHDGDGENHRP